MDKHHITIRKVYTQYTYNTTAVTRLLCSCGYEKDFPSSEDNVRAAVYEHKLDVIIEVHMDRFTTEFLPPLIEEE